MNPRLQIEAAPWVDGPPAVPYRRAGGRGLAAPWSTLRSAPAMIEVPHGALRLRTFIAFSAVLGMHIAIYHLMTRPSATRAIDPVPPAMQVTLIEEERRTVEPVPEPRFSAIPIGALDIPIPEVPNIDPSAVPLNVERPVDLPRAQATFDSRKLAAFDSVANLKELIRPQFDQAGRPVPAEVIAPRGSGGPAVEKLTIDVWIEPSGRVSRANVVRSSGAPWLDVAATQYARTWTLRPGTTRGIAQGMWTEFTLLVGTDPCCTTLRLAQ
jgi:TonB family protein